MDKNRKQVVIATLHFYNNFGSVLQAYALRRTLQGITKGHVGILPYRPALPEYAYFRDPLLLWQYQEKCRKFQLFRNRHLGMPLEGDGYLRTGAEVADALGHTDACIVGSDIVWGREFSGLDPIYFLQQAGQGSRRIAYAASVILDDQGDTEDNGLFARHLPVFDAVSVRETSSVRAIQRFTEKKVSAVLDPTLLLDAADYDALAEEHADMMGRPYLLSYFLVHDPAVVDYTNLLAKKLGLRVIHYFADYPGRVFPADAGCFAFAGPGEFLGYVKNAACIFTNSFHGTCFAMIYRRPFYTYMAKRAMLSRVRDMAGLLGMEGRFFVDFRDIARATLQADYGQFEERLRAERERSLGFLRDALA